jgi:hypothetical protein
VFAGDTVCVPLSDSLPLHAPLAAHALALLLDHVKDADAPAAIVVGLTAMLTVGAGVGA